VDRVGLVEREVDVVLGAGALARLGDGDFVRAADAQAAGVVAAAAVGGGAADRARLDVGDDDLRARDRLPAAVRDETTHARGRALGEDGGGGECGNEGDRQLREPNAVATGHWREPRWGWVVGAGSRQKAVTGGSRPSRGAAGRAAEG